MDGKVPRSSRINLISVVIPVRNRAQQLERLIRALWAQSFDLGRIEIIVVDNASTDNISDTITALQTCSPIPIRYCQHAQDLGPAASRNSGVKWAQGAVVVFFDTDIEPHNRWIEEAVGYLDEHPSVGVVGGMLLYRSRPELVNMYGGELSRLGLGWDRFVGTRAADVPESIECLWAPTAALAVQAEVFQRIGLFDETFYYCYEDSDFCWRANLAGFPCVCLARLSALHDSLPTLRAVGELMVFRACKNRLRSLLKNYSWRSLLGYLPLYIGYAVLEIIARPARITRLRALLWNLQHLRGTWRLRTEMQAARRISDTVVGRLFAPSLLPRTTLATRRQQEMASIASQEELMKQNSGGLP